MQLRPWLIAEPIDDVGTFAGILILTAASDNGPLLRKVLDGTRTQALLYTWAL
jgi:hypothetical protein